MAVWQAITFRPMLAVIGQVWDGLVAVCLVYAMFRDIVVRTIPNMLCLCIAGLALPIRISSHELIRSGLVGGGVFAVLTGLWLVRLIGGGDVKFWTSCSLLLPPDLLVQFWFFMLVLLAGGGIGILYLALRVVAWRGAWLSKAESRGLLLRVWRVELWRARRGGSIPYGVAIALSTILMVGRFRHG